ncbi:hypothetical protein D9M71_796910 [compost metagenome]|jgi:hypothetical protein
MIKFTMATGILTISVGLLLALPSLDANSAERWTLTSYNHKGDPKKKVESSYPSEQECKAARAHYNATHGDRFSTCDRI